MRVLTTNPHRTESRRGVALLMVLVSLLVAATALVSVARQSFRLAADARRARVELQEKWGAESLNRAVLPVAAPIFEARDERLRLVKRPHPTAALRGAIMLGGTRFDVRLADEDAKANVNALYHAGDREKLGEILRKLCGSTNLVALEPEVAALGSEAIIQPRAVVPKAFRGWGQVFRPDVSGVLQATQTISCWGNHAVNVRRAQDDVVVQVASLVLPEATAKAMVTDYRKNRVNEINRIIPRHANSTRARQLLEHLLSESSVCYSLWVRSTRLSDIRDSFAVIERDSEGVLRIRCFDYRGR